MLRCYDRSMRGGAFAWLLVGGVAGCSLFTSFSGLENGTDVPDAASEGSTSNDATTTPDDDAPASDSGDAAPSRSEIYRAAVMADSPLAYFRFEETSGTTTKDETGRHVATLMFAPNMTAPGLFGATDAIEFPVDSQAYVKVDGTDVRFPGTAQLTIEVWVNPAVFRDYQWIISTEATASPRGGWSIFAPAGGYAAYELWPSTGRTLYLQERPLVLGKWQHIVYTYSGAVTAGFIDGVKADSVASMVSAPDVGALVFGCRIADGKAIQCLDGWRLDEIALYGSVLSEARIAEHYALGVPK